jgi:hypothetical protein
MIWMYDIFFISFDEPNAEENWQLLKNRFNRAKRVHGIKGINNAHAECATQSLTKMFWTVDADTVVDDIFNFDYPILPWDEKYIHMWYSRNPVNCLEYGYGSIKLWPCAVAKKKSTNWLDFSTSIGKIKLIEQTISTTKFNTDAFNAWKSGFREAVKLSRSIMQNNDRVAFNRLSEWANADIDVEYAIDTVCGVIDGIEFYIESQYRLEALHMINDFDWLRLKFDNRSTQVKDVDIVLERLVI